MPFTPPPVDDVLAALAGRFGELETSVFRGQSRVIVPETQSLEVLGALR